MQHTQTLVVRISKIPLIDKKTDLSDGIKFLNRCLSSCKNFKTHLKPNACQSSDNYLDMLHTYGKQAEMLPFKHSTLNWPKLSKE